MQRVLFAAGLLIGLAIGYVDSRPSWDDAGMTAGALLIASAAFGAIAPQRPWLWALCVGLWIPLFAIVGRENYASLLALAFAFAGAYGGAFLRRTVLPA